MKKILCVLALLYMVSGSVRACAVTVTNDTYEDVLILTEEVTEAYPLETGKSMVCGAPEIHAEFYVYTRYDDDSFQLAYFVKQYQCSENKLRFDISSLAEHTYDHRHFYAEDYTQIEQ